MMISQQLAARKHEHELSPDVEIRKVQASKTPELSMFHLLYNRANLTTLNV